MIKSELLRKAASVQNRILEIQDDKHSSMTRDFKAGIAWQHSKELFEMLNEYLKQEGKDQ